MKHSVFISKERKVYVGDEALQFLNKKNDVAYLSEQAGITRVDLSRWHEAQGYERRTWMVDLSNYKEDRNSTHKTHFDNYLSLRGQRFDRAIELGCGPFTNIRYVAEITEILHCHLLDPLIEEYLSHPNCTYSRRKLKVKRGLLWCIFKMPNHIPVIIHKDTIEEFQTDCRFDLILMINVIEHCFDASKVFEKILQIAENQAVFVFHERYYSADALHEQLNYEYDAGYPLKVDRKIVDNFLFQNFVPILSKVVHFKREKWGGDRSYDGIYFIGRKVEA